MGNISRGHGGPWGTSVGVMGGHGERVAACDSNITVNQTEPLRLGWDMYMYM